MNEPQLTEADKHRIESAFAGVPFIRFMGIELLGLEHGRAILRIGARDELKRNGDVIHGGVTASLIDTAAAFAIMTLLAPGESTTTVDLTVHYLRPLVTGQATAHARIVRDGRRIVIAAVDVFDDAETLVATSLATYVRV